MAPDTKVPDGRKDGRKDGRTDGQRQNNIPPTMSGDKNVNTYSKGETEVINVASRVLQFYADCPLNFANSVNKKIAPANGGHVFQKPEEFQNSTEMKNSPPIWSIITPDFLTKIHKDLTINVTSTRTQTIFELSPDIISTNFQNKFYEDWT
ncbi:hypothetical protein DPMN_160287 [Dreissena polymorpha]|uniref:Uncharacterized protein n=1 Tax=Dreissena polymorpha TaxID=45954 RepID=A0A9D4EQX8_DREPO|nr:hypothetical protein DPMN_160287 [Dreissena polymorpha]